jgi:hypothetical protein
MLWQWLTASESCVSQTIGPDHIWSAILHCLDIALALFQTFFLAIVILPNCGCGMLLYIIIIYLCTLIFRWLSFHSFSQIFKPSEHAFFHLWKFRLGFKFVQWQNRTVCDKKKQIKIAKNQDQSAKFHPAKINAYTVITTAAVEWNFSLQYLILTEPNALLMSYIIVMYVYVCI